MRRKTLLILAVIAIGTSAGHAQDDAAFVRYRAKVMKSIGADMGAISEILKNGLPLQDNVAVHARSIQTTSGLIESAFKKQVMTPDSESLPAIWEDWETFLKEIQDLDDASGALAEAAEGSDRQAIGLAVRRVGKACGSCHGSFREKDE